MKITNVSIDKRISVFILIVLITILGITSYITLPKESFPDISIPLVIVSTPYFGVSPEDIESLITQPIEKEINTIAEVKKIRSSSFEGYSLVQAEFESGYNIDEALQKVRDKVNKAEPKLPPDVEKPEIVEINFSEFPIMTVNVSGPVGLVKLKDIAEELKDEIENISGVLDVKIRGGLEREVKVDVDLTKLIHYNIRFDDIVNAINNENKTIPGGSIDVNQSSFLVRVPGEFDKPYIIEDIIVKMKDGDPVYIKNVAKVTYGFKDRSTYARVNGNDAVSIDISKRVGENIITIADRVKEILNEKENELPSNVKLYVSADQSKEIKTQVRDLENNIFSGLVLVVVVLFFFLGVRNAFLVAISIPLSMLISFYILQAMGITLNFVVLFALILALGMLVDNAIVIIENIYKFVEEGNSLIDAAKQGTAEVAWPVFTSTMTTVAAFFPLLFWPGVVGDFMYYIPLTLIITLLSSLFVALIINPVVGSVFIKLENPDNKPVTLIQKIFYPFNRITHFFVDIMLPKILSLYEKTLNFALGSRRIPGQKINPKNYLGIVAIIIYLFFIAPIVSQTVTFGFLPIIINAAFGFAILWLFTHNRPRVIWSTFLLLMLITETYFQFDHGIEFFPKTQPPRLYISVNAPSGINIEASNQLLKDIEEKLKPYRENGDVKDIIAVVGASNNPFEGGSSTPNKSTITIQYKDYVDRQQNSLITTDEIRDAIINTPGAEIIIAKEEGGPPVGLPVNIEISGDDYKILAEIAERIKERIKNVAGLVDLKDDLDQGRPELRVDVNRVKAALYGLNTSSIANSIRTAINGTTASKYRVKEDEYDITVRLRSEDRNNAASLENLNIIYNNDKGTTLSVPLISVANIYQDKSPGAIKRNNLKRVTTVSADVAEGFNANEVLAIVQAEMKDFPMPPSYSYAFTGQNEEQEKAEAYISKAFLVALLMIFMILVLQFNSVSQPIIIMTAVIVSLIGVFIGLIFYAMPFGIIMTGIGVISLAGVVVNNNIVLIDYINQLRKRGLSRREAVITAGLRRFRPVTLTAITTILGLIPLTFGFGFDVYTFSIADGGESAEFWRSMGIAVIFGLGFATILTLIIVPVVYTSLEEVPDIIKQGFRGTLYLIKNPKSFKKVFGKN